MRRSIMVRSMRELNRDKEWLKEVFGVWRTETAEHRALRKQWQKLRNLNSLAIQRFVEQASTGREQRKQAELVKEFTNSRLCVGEDVQPLIQKAKTKSRKLGPQVSGSVKSGVRVKSGASGNLVSQASQQLSQEQPDLLKVPSTSNVSGELARECSLPYFADPYVMEEIPLPKRPICKPGARCRHATEKHVKRLEPRPPPGRSKTTSCGPSPLRLRARSARSMHEDVSDGEQLPPVMPHLAPKSTVDAFFLQPILRTSTGIDSAR